MYRIIAHNDLDGFGSAYITKDILSEGVNPNEIKIYNTDYSKDFDLSDFKSGDEVWIIDYSLKPEIMNKLLDITENVTWIDHHKSALEYNSKYNRQVKGIQAIGLSATALVYLWFYAPRELLYLSNEKIEEWLDKNAPRWVNLVDAWDVWKTNSKYYNDSKFLDLAASPQLSLELIEQLNDETFLNSIIKKGKVYDEYLRMSDKCFIEEYGFEIPVMINSTNYKGFVINKGNCSSLAFGDKLKEYDLCISFISNGDVVTVSIYSDKDYIDCSKICKSKGGGGHKGAAGYTIQLKDFNSFNKDEVFKVNI